MAIDFHDLTAITDTLKTVYGEGLTNQFVDEVTTYNEFPKSNRKPGGKGYTFGMRYARAQGIGARGESQNLPDPLVGKYDQATILPKYIYGSLRLTGPAIEMGKGNMMAFVDSLSDSVNDLYQGVIVDLNRQTWGDGFGLIGTLSATSDQVSTTTTWTGTFDNDRGIMYAKPGMLVDFFESTAFDQGSVASRISSVNPATKVVTFEANVGTYKANHPITAAQSYTVETNTIASGAFMVKMGTRTDSHATSDTSYELTGLLGMYDNGTLLSTFEGITVSSFPQWQANLVNNSGIPWELSIQRMLQCLDVTRINSGARVSKIRMGLGQRRKYADLLIGDVRFAPQNLEGGYERLTFSGGDGSVMLVVDPYCQPNKLFFEPDGVIQKYELMPLGWLDRDQQMHMVQGYDMFDQFLAIYTNLGVEQRNCLTLLDDLTEPSLYGA